MLLHVQKKEIRLVTKKEIYFKHQHRKTNRTPTQ